MSGAPAGSPGGVWGAGPRREKKDLGARGQPKRPSPPRAGWRRLEVRPGVSSASAAGASSRRQDAPGRAGQRALGGGRRGPASRAGNVAPRPWLIGRSRECLGVPRGGCPRPEPASGPPTFCGPGAGDQGCAFSFGGMRRTERCLSVSLFRENLCSPGVLPELLLLLGSLPRWGETGNSL